MIAKFHSAPGHSMETTLKFNLPPMQEATRIKEKERAREIASEKELKAEERREKRQRKKEEQERAKRQQDKDLDPQKHVENERDRDSQVREYGSSRVHTERTGSYKDKFQKMREKYDKVIATHEISQRDLELLNAKIKKLQAENELLLDAMLAAETDLYERYFDRSASSSPVPNPTLTTPSQTTQNQQQAPTIRFTLSHRDPPPQSGSSAPLAGSMAPPTSSVSTGGPPGSAGLRPMPPPPPQPPVSVSSNGTVVSNGTNASNSMPPPSSTVGSNGTAASPPHGRRAMWNAQASPFVSGTPRSRRRSSGTDAGNLPLAPEDVTSNGNGPRADVHTPTPMVLDSQQEVDEPIRTPRINGSNSPAVIPHSAVVNGNGMNSRPQADPSRETTPGHEQNSENHDVQPEEDHSMALDVDDDVGPASPGPEAGAGVHSPIDEDEDWAW